MERIFTNASDKKAASASKSLSNRVSAPQSSPRKKSARASVERTHLRALGTTLALVAVVLATLFPAPPLRAIVIATPPPGQPIASALGTPHPSSTSLFFTLDDPLSSVTSQRGEIVRAHLTYPLRVDGVTLAPAGSPELIKVLNVRAAASGDVYGYVDIFFEPLKLTDGKTLPLVAPSSRLTVHTTIGHETTVGVEDTVANILFPPHVLYQVFRRGRNIDLGKGTQVRAQVGALVTVADGQAFIATPPPLPVLTATPAAAFTPIPLMTPAHPHIHGAHPSPRPTASPTPLSTPTPSPTPTSSPA